MMMMMMMNSLKQPFIKFYFTLFLILFCNSTTHSVGIMNTLDESDEPIELIYLLANMSIKSDSSISVFIT